MNILNYINWISLSYMEKSSHFQNVGKINIWAVEISISISDRCDGAAAVSSSSTIQHVYLIDPDNNESLT